MKGFILSGLSVLLVSALNIPTVKAEVPVDDRAYMVQPVNLVYLGYQGHFEKQGVPSNLGFIEAIQSGKINSTTLVTSAIEQGKLSPETLNNQDYLNNVQSALEDIDHD